MYGIRNLNTRDIQISVCVAFVSLCEMVSRPILHLAKIKILRVAFVSTFSFGLYSRTYYETSTSMFDVWHTRHKSHAETAGNLFLSASCVLRELGASFNSIWHFEKRLSMGSHYGFAFSVRWSRRFLYPVLISYWQPNHVFINLLYSGN